MIDKYLPDITATKYFYEKKRLETFQKWPFGARSLCNPQRMAEAGWFAVEGLDVYDVAKCMICDKELDGWEETDDPWEEHSKRCPKCPFVVVHKKQSDWKISDYFNYARGVLICNIEKEMDTKVTNMKKLLVSYENKKLGSHNIIS